MSDRQDTAAVEDNVAIQAERWFARMRSDRIEPVDEFRFRNWLQEDPAHEREYRGVQQLWDDLSEYGHSDEVLAMRYDALAKAGNKGPASFSSTHFLSFLRLRGKAGMAAAAAVVLLIGTLFAVNPTIYTATYETGVGGRNSHSLLDGTRITLNTDTSLQVQYDLRSRHVRLENGQAHFEVTRSRYWPFEVDAGASVVRALGTTFDVYRRDDETRVTLLEGRVEVTGKGPAPQSTVHSPQSTNQPQSPSSRTTNNEKRKTVLQPGQQVVVSTRGVSDIRRASTPETTAWLHGRLVFDGERLGDAIAEVNRYSPVKLTIDDPKLANVRISGVFRAGGAETFVDALEASFPVRARVRADGNLALLANTDGPLPEHIGGLK